MTVFTLVTPKVVTPVKLIAVPASRIHPKLQAIARAHGAITVKGLVLISFQDYPRPRKARSIYTLAGERIDRNTPVKPL